MTERTLGIIGGSGLYDLPGIEGREEHRLETPFGSPSDAVITGHLHGVRMAFLPRHGRGHRIAPHELPFRANIHAMKQLEIECVLGISAVGSMREDIAPGDLVLVDQFIDRTRGRTAESTFFGDGCAAHAHFADPIWEPLRQVALQAARNVGATAHDGGIYLVGMVQQVGNAGGVAVAGGLLEPEAAGQLKPAAGHNARVRLADGGRHLEPTAGAADLSAAVDGVPIRYS